MAIYYPPARTNGAQMVHDASGVLYQPGAGRAVVADNSIEDELLGNLNWSRNALQSNYYRDLILGDGGTDLVAFWRFEGSTSDASGNGRSTTTAGSGVTVGAGALNTGTQSRATDGTTNTFLNAITGADVVLSDFTIEGWHFNSNALTAGTGAMLAGWSLANTRAFRFIGRRGLGASSYYFGVSPSNGGAETSLQPTAATDNQGVWVHWAAGRSGSTLFVYRNGVSVGSGAIGTGTIAVARWYMATDTGSGTGNPLTGLIDEVAVYSRALTPSEIINHYSAGVQGYL